MSDANLDQYRGYLRALAQIELERHLQSKVDPSDIVQQSLLEAHQDLASLKGKSEGELVAWLRMIFTRNLLNTARDYNAQKRDARRERSLAQQVEDSSVRLDQFLAGDQSTPSQRASRYGRRAASPSKSRTTKCCCTGWNTCTTIRSSAVTWMIRCIGGIRARGTMHVSLG